MGRIYHDSLPGATSAQISLADHVPELGVYTPHPNYTGTIRVIPNAVARGMFGNPLEIDTAMYVASPLPDHADVHFHFLFSAQAATNDAVNAFCWRVKEGGDDCLMFFNVAGTWVLAKNVAGVITGIAVSATPALSYPNQYIITGGSVGNKHSVAVYDVTALTSTLLSATDSAVPNRGRFGIWASGGGAYTGSEPNQVPSASLIFYASTSASSAIEGGTNEGAVTLPSLTVAATGTLGTGTPDGVTGSAGITLPQVQVSAELIHQQALVGVLPQITSQIVATFGHLMAFDLELPQIEVQAAGARPQGDITVPQIEVAATLLNGTVGSAAIVLPSVAVAADAVATLLIEGDVTLPQITVASEGLVGAIASAGVRLPAPHVLASGFAGLAIEGDVTLPQITLSARGHPAYIGTLAATLPLPTAYLQTVADTLSVARVIAMNLRNAAITEYSGWTFNSLATWRGRLFGAGASGVHEVTGSADGATPIAASMRTGVSDLSNLPGAENIAPFLKRPTDAYASYESDVPLVFSVYVDDQVYDYDMPQGRYSKPKGVTSKIRPHKCSLGRGIKSHYLGYGLRNVEGGDFKLDSIRVLVDVLPGRRV